MARPSFQFYPGDWQRDSGLRVCSLGARGLWIEMLCIMHQAEPYGYLKVNHMPILPNILARMVGATIEEVEGWLGELEAAGVFDREENVIFSRRMVKDENLRKIRAAGGILGGNPALKVKDKDCTKVNLTGEDEVKQKSTPSSSSSSSNNSIRRKKKTGVPESFDPSPSHVEKAKSTGLNISREVQKFLNHHGAKGNTFHDWGRAFHTWLDNAVDFGHGKTTPHDQNGLENAI